MRLHAHNGILLRIKVAAPAVNFGANQKLVQFVAVSEQGLFRNKLEKRLFLGALAKC